MTDDARERVLEAGCGIPECSRDATCVGRYEGHGPITTSCDVHCGHGNEDGWCVPIDETDRILAALQKTPGERTPLDMDAEIDAAYRRMSDAQKQADREARAAFAELRKRIHDPDPEPEGEPDGYLTRYIADEEPGRWRFISLEDYDENPLAEGHYETRPICFTDPDPELEGRPPENEYFGGPMEDVLADCAAPDPDPEPDGEDLPHRCYKCGTVNTIRRDDEGFFCIMPDCDAAWDAPATSESGEEPTQAWIARVEEFFWHYANGLDTAGSSEAARFEAYYDDVRGNPEPVYAVNALLSCWCWLRGSGNDETVDKIADLLVDGVSLRRAPDEGVGEIKAAADHIWTEATHGPTANLDYIKQQAEIIRRRIHRGGDDG